MDCIPAHPPISVHETSPMKVSTELAIPRMCAARPQRGVWRPRPKSRTAGYSDPCYLCPHVLVPTAPTEDIVTSAPCKYKHLDPILLRPLCCLSTPPNIVHWLVHARPDRAFTSHFTLSTTAPQHPSRCRHGGRIWVSPGLGIPLSSLDEASRESPGTKIRH